MSAKYIMCVLLSYLLLSCKDSGSSSQSKIDIEALEKSRAEKLQALAQLEKEQEEAKLKEKEAELAAIEAAEKLKELEKLKMQQELDRIAAEKETKRLEEIKQRQAAQERARDLYVGTKYDRLELLNGKILQSAVATKASAAQITYMHKNGVANVKYSNLPKEIAEKCRYDPELELIAAEEKKALQKKMQEARKIADENKPKASNFSTAKRTVKPQSPKKVEEEKKKAITPRGRLSVKVVGYGKGGKTINVEARANVDATLYLNDLHDYRRYVYEVKAGVTYSHVWRRVSTTYEAKLVSKSGKVLDVESDKRKSGL